MAFTYNIILHKNGELGIEMKKNFIVSVLLAGFTVICGNTSARINLPEVAGLWLFDDGKGDVLKDSSDNDNQGGFLTLVPRA
jgi:hypothetical protein|tara:strand:+ start:91 stop:336 length:246 start_codon:yes stop_codon:yes gene_type:complete